MKKLMFLMLLTGIISCGEDVQPKPGAYLALEYPLPEYHLYKGTCPYSFQKTGLRR
jgi:hypothetical protein